MCADVYSKRKGQNQMTKTARVDLVLTAELKAAAMEASKDKRGGLSQVVRELLTAWLAGRKKPGK